jgi:hypothetical protein
MRGRIPDRLVSAALLVALAPWCAGCATEIHLRQSPGAVEGAGGGCLLVRVFDNRSDRKRDVTTHRTIVTELYRVEGKAENLLSEERESRWSVPDMPPGEYVLRVAKWVDEKGVVQKLPHRQDEEFLIRTNETTVADVVLSDPEKAWVKVGIGVVVVVGLSYLLGREMMKNWHPLGNLRFE